MQFVSELTDRYIWALVKANPIFFSGSRVPVAVPAGVSTDKTVAGEQVRASDVSHLPRSITALIALGRSCVFASAFGPENSRRAGVPRTHNPQILILFIFCASGSVFDAIPPVLYFISPVS